ncbi:MAG: hypothetical protein V3V14_00675 [Saprospiraceae bacterium]
MIKLGKGFKIYDNKNKEVNDMLHGLQSKVDSLLTPIKIEDKLAKIRTIVKGIQNKDS